jgi:DNA-binding transcriptional LysR family regulator
MNNREYEYVSAISKAGTLSKAAVELGISQPALTRFLQKEEAEIGTKLFQKIGNRLVLTYAGECYMEHAEQILSIQKKMMTTIHDIAQMDMGRIRIGVPSIRCPYTIFSVIPEYKKKFPSIDIALHENGSNQLEEALKNLSLDVIAVNITKQKDDFLYNKIANEEYVLAVPAGHPLCREARQDPDRKYPVISPSQMEGLGFIMLERGHRIRQFADTLLDSNHVRWDLSMKARTLETALASVSCGLGCTFSPEVPLRYIRGGKNIRYLSLEAPDTQYEFCLLTRKGAYLPPYMKAFIQIFCDNYEQMTDMNLYE